MAEETLVIFCQICGKTTEKVNPHDFWKGKVEQSKDPEEMVPEWTCKECVIKLVPTPQTGSKE